MSSQKKAKMTGEFFLQESDFFVSAILLAVFSYFIVGVFAHYSISIFTFFLILISAHFKGIKSYWVATSCIVFIVSLVLINAHHYMHSLVMIIMLGLFFLNKRMKNLWVQNSVIAGFLLLLIFKPGMYLIIFSNYDRMLLSLYHALQGMIV